MLYFKSKPEWVAFLAFLKKEKALAAYIYEMLKAKNYKLTYYRCYMEPERYLTAAFNWVKVKDGSRYWAKLGVKWNKEVEKL